MKESGQQHGRIIWRQREWWGGGAVKPSNDDPPLSIDNVPQRVNRASGTKEEMGPAGPGQPGMRHVTPAFCIFTHVETCLNALSHHFNTGNVRLLPL